MDSRGIVYLMRGLPSCGKSYTARRLAGETGVVLETDEYFYLMVGKDPGRFDYQEDLLPKARQWNFDRFVRAVAAGISPILVDRGNGLNPETRRYAQHAVDHGYEVRLQEPESEWWQEIRVLLKYKKVTREILYETHRVPVETIRHWMDKWRHDLTIEQILGQDP